MQDTHDLWQAKQPVKLGKVGLADGSASSTSTSPTSCKRPCNRVSLKR
jgi:hypothetical protein